MDTVDHRHSMITFAAAVYGSCSNGAELIQEIESLNDVADKVSVTALSSIEIAECYHSWTVQDLLNNLDADLNNMQLFKMSLQENIKTALICWQTHGYTPTDFTGLDMDLLGTVGLRLCSIFVTRDGKQLHYNNGLWRHYDAVFTPSKEGLPCDEFGEALAGSFSFFRRSETQCH
ncbi:hypothetical protein [Motilimonas eburnea]|uniref:hypothetical protein n=1 Tax=Motilimonas eburnea TaxID=1737488 RepID=UPI001E3F21D3|nr:hypothetical protein [Motilimonas eburnea]MCE2571725.1 hypothetical protein [Motilimonas eburnea]